MAACLDESRQCKVCFDCPRTVVFQPCSHLVCCPACAKRVESCPVCRKPILRRDRLAECDDDDDLADRTFDIRREVVAEEPTFIQDADMLSPAVVIDRPELISRSNGRSPIITSTGTLVWVKVIRGVRSKTDRERVLREVCGEAASISYDNLVRLCEGCFAKNDTIHIIQEFMDLGSLADMQNRRRRRSRSWPPEMQARVLSQVIQALCYVHEMQLVYNSLEMDSILLNSQGDVKLSYLPRICSEIKDSWRMDCCIVASDLKTYISPERLCGEDYSFQSDSWSVGVLTYELASGSYPFDIQSFPKLYEEIFEKPEPRLDAATFSPEHCDFAARCLTRDPCQRLAASELRDHPYLTEHAASKEALAHWLVTPEAENEDVVY